MPGRLAESRPPPAAPAASAAPITAARSARRASANTGNSTCVAPHPRHRDRRGRSLTRLPPAPRSTRGRACPHRPRTPAHPGHSRSPDPSLRSTDSPLASTVSMAPPSATQRPSRHSAKRSPGGPQRVHHRQGAAAHHHAGTRPGQPSRISTTPLPSSLSPGNYGLGLGSPAVPAWLFAPCSSYGLGGVAPGTAGA